ncbi:MAG: hypothetical protein WC145_11505 [Aliarcobacter sp.]
MDRVQRQAGKPTTSRQLAYAFWDRVDRCNPYKTAKELADEIGMPYSRMRQERSDGTFPKPRFIKAICKELRKEDYELLLGLGPGTEIETVPVSEENKKLLERLRHMPPTLLISPQAQRIFDKFKNMDTRTLDQIESYVDFVIAGQKDKPEA